MSLAIVTGSSGLIGSETVEFLCCQGFDVIGIDNDMRGQFFGPEASTAWIRERLLETYSTQYRHESIDIRDGDAIERVFRGAGKAIDLVVHAAAQPSHDWAAREPETDFTVNANGTLVLLETTRRHCPDAVFVFTSTNKVYGDRPNALPLVELETRWEIEPSHPYHRGIDETMSVDGSTHSLFGASKLAADVLVQEYGRYFGLKTVCFRGGCLTGPNHSGTVLHGFLAYLMKCVCTGTRYTVFGYGGKQVRDNIHSYDLVNAFFHFYQHPRAGEVYNIGGSRRSHCSMIEAIGLCEEIAERKLEWEYSETNRIGDHIWYISDIRKFEGHYREWSLEYDLEALVRDLYERNVERWVQEAGTPASHAG
jgi:CDP-paratose 2-epimerase